MTMHTTTQKGPLKATIVFNTSSNDPCFLCITNDWINGLDVGKPDGWTGGSIVGLIVGPDDGFMVGSVVGLMVGLYVGSKLGYAVGSNVGCTVGSADG